jgi:hypothetical protein
LELIPNETARKAIARVRKQNERIRFIVLPPKTNVLGREGYYLSVGLTAGIYASALQMSINRGTPERGAADSAIEKSTNETGPNRGTKPGIFHGSPKSQNETRYFP